MSPPESLREIPDAPIYRIEPNGTSSVSTESIRDAIEKRGKLVVESAHWNFYTLAPTQPHHETHVVMWAAKTNVTGKIVEWKPEHWHPFSSDTHAQDQAQQYILLAQKEDPYLRAYMYMGHVYAWERDEFKKNGLGRYFHLRGVQSLPPPHWHLARSIGPYDVPHQYLDANQRDYELQLTFLLNDVGEETINLFTDELEQHGYREMLQYEIAIGRYHPIHRQRTVFGFSSLAEAIEQSYALAAAVTPDWISRTMPLAKKYPFFGGWTYQQQCVTPCSSIFIPSLADRDQMNIPNHTFCLVQPFTIEGIHHTYGGYILDRSYPTPKQVSPELTEGTA